jgi:hypothetical protein
MLRAAVADMAGLVKKCLAGKAPAQQSMWTALAALCLMGGQSDWCAMRRPRIWLMLT